MGNVDLSYKSHASGLVTPSVEENGARAFGLIVRVHSLFIFDVDNVFKGLPSSAALMSEL